jgi:hypothetical protein
MQDQVNATPTSHRQVTWNKDKLTGGKAAASTSGRSRRSFRSKGALATRAA